jgi:hypothetical protein
MSADARLKETEVADRLPFADPQEAVPLITSLPSPCGRRACELEVWPLGERGWCPAPAAALARVVDLLRPFEDAATESGSSSPPSTRSPKSEATSCVLDVRVAPDWLGCRLGADSALAPPATAPAEAPIALLTLLLREPSCDARPLLRAPFSELRPKDSPGSRWAAEVPLGKGELSIPCMVMYAVLSYWTHVVEQALWPSGRESFASAAKQRELTQGARCQPV